MAFLLELINKVHVECPIIIVGNFNVDVSNQTT